MYRNTFRRMGRKALPLLLGLPAVVSHKLRGAGVRILMYHRVINRPGDRLSVRPREFEQQMKILLEKGYRIGTLSEVLGPGAPDVALPPAVAITFDDGYRDFYDVACPVLREYRLPATVFVVPDYINGKISLQRYGGGSGTSGPVSWDMLKKMSSQGITIGAHSSTHRELTGLRPREAKREIEESAAAIESRLGTRPEWFAYPRGKYTPDLARLVQEAGYRGAVTVRPGANYPPYDLYALRRTEISGDDDLRDFRLKLQGRYDLWHRIWQSLAGNKL